MAGILFEYDREWVKWASIREDFLWKNKIYTYFQPCEREIKVCRSHMVHVVGTEWIENLQEPKKHFSNRKIIVLFKSRRYVLSKALMAYRFPKTIHVVRLGPLQADIELSP